MAVCPQNGGGVGLWVRIAAIARVDFLLGWVCSPEPEPDPFEITAVNSTGSGGLCVSSLSQIMKLAGFNFRILKVIAFN